MATTQFLMFALLGLMVLVWFWCVSRLSGQLRERHSGKYEEMGLEGMWPKDLGGWIAGHNNAAPVMALLRFLWRREDAELLDVEVSSLASFMRWLFFGYLVVFCALVYSLFAMDARPQRRPDAADVSTSTNGIEYRRERLFVPYREKRYADAIAAYDALQPEAGRDALLTYWRGMAHWQLGEVDLALRDFRRTIELEPANFDAHRNADRILTRQQHWDEILALWNPYIAKHPADARALFERAGTNFHKGDRAAAQADAARACELGKQEACAWVERLTPWR